ncbi:MAG: hypothetical protein AB1603_08335, partial [Chloroflexota bacterium]
MRRTGVFYHDVVGRMAYASLAMSVEEGFRSVERSGLLSEPNVMLFEADGTREIYQSDEDIMHLCYCWDS